MTSLVRRLRPIFSWARNRAILGFEIGTIALSLFAARTLLTDQEYFDHKPAYNWVTVHVTGQEWVMGTFAALAALLKIVGLICLFAKTDKTIEYAFIAREIGWGISAVFWSTMGVSIWVWDPNNISGGSTLVIGLFSFGMTFMGPVMLIRSNDGQ